MPKNLIARIVKHPVFIYTIGLIGIFSGFLLAGDYILKFMNNHIMATYAAQWSLIWGAFIFSLYAYYFPKNIYVIKTGKDNYDIKLSVIRKLSLKLRKSDGAVFTYDGITHEFYVDINGTWEKCLNQINIGKHVDDTVTISDYGSKYYLVNMLNLNKIKIPTETSVTKIIGDSVENGMVLMLRKYD